MPSPMQLRHNRPAPGQYERYASEVSPSDHSSDELSAPETDIDQDVDTDVDPDIDSDFDSDIDPDTVPAFSPPPAVPFNPNLPPAAFPSLPPAEAAVREHSRRVLRNSAVESAPALNGSLVHGGDVQDVQGKKQPSACLEKSIPGSLRADSSSFSQVTKSIPRVRPGLNAPQNGGRILRGNRARLAKTQPTTTWQPKEEWKADWWSCDDEVRFQKEMSTEDDEPNKDVTWEDILPNIRIEIVEGLANRGYSSARRVTALGLTQEQTDAHSDLIIEHNERLNAEDAFIKDNIKQIGKKFKKLKESGRRVIEERFDTFDGVALWARKFLQLDSPMQGLVDLTMNQALPQSSYGRIIDKKLQEMREVHNGPVTKVSRADLKVARAWLRKRGLDVALVGSWRDTTCFTDLSAECYPASPAGASDGDLEFPIPYPDARDAAHTPLPVEANELVAGMLPPSGAAVGKKVAPRSFDTGASSSKGPNARDLSKKDHSTGSRDKSARHQTPHPPSTPRSRPATTLAMEASPAYAPQPVARKSSMLNVRQRSAPIDESGGHAQLDLQRSRESTYPGMTPYFNQREHDRLRLQQNNEQVVRNMLSKEPDASLQRKHQRVRASLERGLSDAIPTANMMPPPSTIPAPVARMGSVPVARMTPTPATMVPSAPMRRIASAPVASMMPSMPNSMAPIMPSDETSSTEAQKHTGNTKKRAAPSDSDENGAGTVQCQSTEDRVIAPISKRQRVSGPNTVGPNVSGLTREPLPISNAGFDHVQGNTGPLESQPGSATAWVPAQHPLSPSADPFGGNFPVNKEVPMNPPSHQGSALHPPSEFDVDNFQLGPTADTYPDLSGLGNPFAALPDGNPAEPTSLGGQVNGINYLDPNLPPLDTSDLDDLSTSPTGIDPSYQSIYTDNDNNDNNAIAFNQAEFDPAFFNAFPDQATYADPLFNNLPIDTNNGQIAGDAFLAYCIGTSESMPAPQLPATSLLAAVEQDQQAAEMQAAAAQRASFQRSSDPFMGETSFGPDVMSGYGMPGANYMAPYTTTTSGTGYTTPRVSYATPGTSFDSLGGADVGGAGVQPGTPKKRGRPRKGESERAHPYARKK